MGMYDTVVILDGSKGLACPHGHALRSFQTKDFDEPSMGTYLVRDDRLYLAAAGPDRWRDDDDAAGWRVDGGTAIREYRYELREMGTPRTVRVYGQCHACEPVLVRTDRPGFSGDIVQEHDLFVDFSLMFRAREPMQAERTSGTRDDMKKDLLSRGLCVLGDDEPLAVAHREVKTARERLDQSKRRRAGL